jgi:AcrR family transcriptional regulator
MSRKPIPNVEKKIVKEVYRQARKKSVAKISTLEASKKLKISEPVIFSRFASKEELVDSVFQIAWNSLSHPLTLPDDATDEGLEEGLAKYKAKVEDRLAHADEIVYINAYMNSKHYSSKKGAQIMGGYITDIVAYLKSHISSLSDKEAKGLALRYAESEVAVDAHIALSHEAMDDQLVKSLYLASVIGFIPASRKK